MKKPLLLLVSIEAFRDDMDYSRDRGWHTEGPRARKVSGPDTPAAEEPSHKH
jgi:hypothetical protein